MGNILAMGLLAVMAAQEGMMSVTHSFRTTPLEELAQRSVLVAREIGTDSSPMVTGAGTAYLYRQDAMHDFYATNNHVVQPFDCGTGFAIYDNGVQRQRLRELKLVYADPNTDLAILVTERSEKTYAEVPVLLDELDLGEQVTAIGYPASEMQQVIPGIVSSHTTLSVDGTPAIPGYQLHMAGFPGVSGSGIFIKREGRWHWAGLASSSDIRYPTVQITAARNFYSIAMSIDGDEPLKCASSADEP